MPELKINSGTMKINSGTVKVNPRQYPLITATFNMNHAYLDPGGGTMIARYSVGLDSTVSYSSGYLFRGEFSKTADGTFTEVTISGTVPGAVASDGVVDCWFYMESPTDGVYPSPGLGGFADDVQVGNPTATNNRFPIKFDGGVGYTTPTVTVEDIEWEV